MVYPQRFDAAGRGTARVAVSDGASESAFAREWANALTDAFVTRPPELDAPTGGLAGRVAGAGA